MTGLRASRLPCGTGHKGCTMGVLLHLLSGVALLVWGTNIVKVGILRVYGANLRHVLSVSVSNRFTAFLAGSA
jgi:phosphate:Na+ symporter